MPDGAQLMYRGPGEQANYHRPLGRLSLTAGRGVPWSNRDIISGMSESRPGVVSRPVVGATLN